jgi:hypothetical protein
MAANKPDPSALPWNSPATEDTDYWVQKYGQPENNPYAQSYGDMGRQIDRGQRSYDTTPTPIAREVQAQQSNPYETPPPDIEEIRRMSEGAQGRPENIIATAPSYESHLSSYGRGGRDNPDYVYQRTPGPLSQGEIAARENPPQQAALPHWNKNWGTVPDSGWAESQAPASAQAGPYGPEDERSPSYKGAQDLSYSKPPASEGSKTQASGQAMMAKAAGGAQGGYGGVIAGIVGAMGSKKPKAEASAPSKPAAPVSYSSSIAHQAANQYFAMTPEQQKAYDEVIWNRKIGR